MAITEWQRLDGTDDEIAEPVVPNIPVKKSMPTDAFVAHDDFLDGCMNGRPRTPTADKHPFVME